MSITDYTTLTRQMGLMREMDIIAQNIANAGTTGFKSEAMVFTEYVQGHGELPSTSFGAGHGRFVDLSQAEMEQTGGSLDLAIEGEGFFAIEGPDGPRLTRAGAFTVTDIGGLVTHDGTAVLDAGEAPIFLPVGATTYQVAADGTLSADGQPVAQLGIFTPADPLNMPRSGAASFEAPDGLLPVELPRISQGFLEASNVKPVEQISRMIAVQHAYEAGQNFLTREDERLRSVSRLFET